MPPEGEASTAEGSNETSTQENNTQTTTQETTQETQTVSPQVNVTLNDILSEDLRGNETITRFKSANDLAKSYLEARSKLGGAISIPKEGASPEEMAEFRQKLGMPKDKEEYGITTEDGDKLGEGAVEWFKEAAHELGLPKDQAIGLFQKYKDWTSELMENDDKIIAQAQEEADASLRKEWGRDYDNNMKQVGLITTRIFSEEAQKTLNDYGVGDDPNFMKDLLNLSKKLTAEPDTADTDNKQGGMQALNIREEMASLANSPDFYESEVKQARMTELSELLVNAGKVR